MDDLLDRLVTAASGMWKRRWLGLLVAWVVGVLACLAVMLMPDRYEASARIFVDTQSILKPLMSGLAVQPNVDQQVVMLSRTLISRPNMEKLIRMADLDLKVRSRAEQDALIDELMKTLDIKNLGRDNLYVLSYRDTSPQKATKVVQSLVSIFVESSMGDSRKDSSAARKFIDEQIKTYVTKLNEAEARLKDFKVRNIELQNMDGRDMSEQLRVLGDQLGQAQLDLREAENAREAARRQVAQEKTQGREESTRGLLQESALAAATPELDARIEAQKRNLDMLLQRYTEQHPDVASTRRMLADLEEARSKEAAALRKTALQTPVLVSTNTLAFQELYRVMAAQEVQVAALRARVGEYSARMARARELMKVAPQVEAELAQLNRDYDIDKKNYNDLVTRREAAALTGDLESAAGVANFRLIDPPRAASRPVAPNRFLLLALALLVALGAGAGAALLASRIQAVFFDGRSLRQSVGLPLLGVVTLVRSETALLRERAELRRFAAALGSLLGAYALGMVVVTVLSNRA
jgi:polysaccharide chain length determinant protein (PEP-CTERM system associated)